MFTSRVVGGVLTALLEQLFGVMAENKRSESTEVRSASVPTPCVKGCGFYGTSSTLDMCSKCYREHLRQEQQRLQVESVCQQQQQQKHEKEGVDTSEGTELQELTSPIETKQIEEKGEVYTVESYAAEGRHEGTSKFVQNSQEKQQQGGEQQSLTALQQEKTEQKPKNRCQWCNKKVGLTGFSCRCGYVFCAEHRYSDKHNCSYDFKSQNKELLSKANPQVVASKINKI